MKVLRDNDLQRKINESVPKLLRYYKSCNEFNKEEIKAILKSHPDLLYYSIPNAKFKTVFHFAAINNDLEFYEFLHSLEPNGVHFGDKYNFIPLYYVSDNNNIEFFKRLVEFGSNVNHVDKKGANVLYRSVAYSNTEMFKHIVSLDVNVNIQSEMGRTALIKSSDIISLFVQKEKNQNSPRSPCHRRKHQRLKLKERSSHGLLGAHGRKRRKARE
jgi:ankyrin repeat protein